MQSNTVVHPGLSFYQGPFATPEVRGNTAGVTTFTVTDGLVQGADRTRPNPVSFVKEESLCLRASRKLVIRQGPLAGEAQHWYGHKMEDTPAGEKFNFMLFDHNSRDALYDRAFAKVFDQLRGDSEVVVDLLESAATLRMLRSTAKFVDGIGTILSIVGHKVHRSGHRGQRALDYATQKWLEYRYGWTPLVNSVYSAFDNLSRWQANEIRLIVARSGSFSKESGLVKVTTQGYGPYDVAQTKTMRERMLISYAFDVGGMSRIGDWTSLNPATIAWELLPFSFVADWFFSIGDSLRNLENWWLYRSRFHSGFDTYCTLGYAHRKMDTYKLFEPGEKGYNDWYTSEEINAEGYLLRKTKQRVVRTALPAPRGPRFRLRMGTEKCLDAAALLQTMFGKKSREWARMSNIYTE